MDWPYLPITLNSCERTIGNVFTVERAHDGNAALLIGFKDLGLVEGDCEVVSPFATACAASPAGYDNDLDLVTVSHWAE
ncbi:MAG: hypothetical protein ACLUD2_21430 [Clostridium sp.]